MVSCLKLCSILFYRPNAIREVLDAIKAEDGKYAGLRLLAELENIKDMKTLGTARLIHINYE